MIKLFRAIIMGAPASGKGTISSRIVKNFKMKHISSGDILRFHMMNKTEMGLKAKQFVNQGQLVPDNIMSILIMDALKKAENSSWLLDGYPRTEQQANQLCSSEHINVVINLVVPFHIIIDRVKGRWIHLSSGRVYNIHFNSPKVMGKDDITGEDLVQRPDDKPEAVQRRLDIYSHTVEPVLNFYRKAGILKEFHGETSDEIWPHVLQYLTMHMNHKSHLT